VNIQLQLKLAKETGFDKINKQSWEKSYKYHLGAVKDPFPFEKFRTKARYLDRLLKKDPDGLLSSIDGKINQLCRELGY